MPVREARHSNLIVREKSMWLDSWSHGALAGEDSERYARAVSCGSEWGGILDKGEQ